MSTRSQRRRKQQRKAAQRSASASTPATSNASALNLDGLDLSSALDFDLEAVLSAKPRKATKPKQPPKPTASSPYHPAFKERKPTPLRYNYRAVDPNHPPPTCPAPVPLPAVGPDHHYRQAHATVIEDLERQAREARMARDATARSASAIQDFLIRILSAPTPPNPTHWSLPLPPT